METMAEQGTTKQTGGQQQVKPADKQQAPQPAANAAAAARAAIEQAKERSGGAAGAPQGARTPGAPRPKKDKPEHSPKHKASRGVPADWKTTWVPVDMPPADNETVAKAAKVRDCSVLDIYKQIIEQALNRDGDAWKAIVADAAKAPEPKASTSLENKTPEQLQAEVTKAEQRLKDIQARIEQMKAAAAAKGAEAEGK